MEEERDIDKKTYLVPSEGSKKSKKILPSVDVVKSAFITEGLTEIELCEKFGITEQQVSDLVKKHDLNNLRNKYIREGLDSVQSGQMNQAQRLLDIEAKFRELRILQLENELRNYLAYYARHGTFNKFHPVTGELLEDSDGIPMQVRIPNIIKEIDSIKGSVNLSEGLRQLIISVGGVINPPLEGGPELEGDVIDLNNIDGLFQPSE